MLEASKAIKVATRNQDVLRRTDNQIREAERSLLYFENMLQDLSAKKKQEQGEQMTRGHQFRDRGWHLVVR